MIDSDVHLKAVDCFRVGTHHHSGIVDEYMKVVDLWTKRKTKRKNVTLNDNKFQLLVSCDAAASASLTSQKFLSERSYGAGVCQIQLSHFHFGFRVRGSYTGGGLLALLHVSARHYHPSAWDVQEKRGRKMIWKHQNEYNLIENQTTWTSLWVMSGGTKGAVLCVFIRIGPL